MFSALRTNILDVFLIASMHATYSVHLILREMITKVVKKRNHEASHFTVFLHPPFAHFPLGSNILLSILFSDILNLFVLSYVKRKKSGNSN